MIGNIVTAALAPIIAPAFTGTVEYLVIAGGASGGSGSGGVCGGGG
jgi:hypothetical protein